MRMHNGRPVCNECGAYADGLGESHMAPEVDQKLEAVMRRLAFALSSREAADAIKELVETILERRS